MEKLKEIRKTILKMVHDANVSHVGSALSVVDILYTLYFRVANVSPQNITDPNRDVIILSKGHASTALYSVLYHRGYLSQEAIDNYAKDGGSLPCHVDKEKSPFFEASTGSLGHGPSLALGFAMAKKIDNNSGRVFVICGDGECDEGSVWEAIMFAGSNKLNNYVLVIDYNRLQAFGTTDEVINLENLDDRLRSFGFETIVVDGHNIEELERAINFKPKDKPLAILAKTIKGKGVSFMENKLEWHYKSPNDEQYRLAIEEIERRY